MITSGGEVAFVQSMIQESLVTDKVLWWTCMLGKLSSVITLCGELKQLAKEGKVAGWDVDELDTRRGRTKRWVIMWTRAETGLRLFGVSVTPLIHPVIPSRRERTLLTDESLFVRTVLQQW